MQKVPRGDYRFRFAIALMLLLAVGLGGGCAARQTLVKNSGNFQENEKLLTGFREYWNLVARREVDKAFTREAPHLQEMVDENNYRLYMKLLYKADLQAVEILGVSCAQPFYCCFDCRLTFQVDGREEQREKRDCWVRVQNKWYHVFKNPIIFPQLGKRRAAGHRLLAAR